MTANGSRLPQKSGGVSAALSRRSSLSVNRNNSNELLRRAPSPLGFCTAPGAASSRSDNCAGPPCGDSGGFTAPACPCCGRIALSIRRSDHLVFGIGRNAVALKFLLAREHLLAQRFEVDLQRLGLGQHLAFFFLN